MNKKLICIVYFIVLIVCLVIICLLVNTINKKDEEIQNYQIELNDRDWQLYIEEMKADEAYELFMSCVYPNGIPEEEE